MRKKRKKKLSVSCSKDPTFVSMRALKTSSRHLIRPDWWWWYITIMSPVCEEEVGVDSLASWCVANKLAEQLMRLRAALPSTLRYAHTAKLRYYLRQGLLSRSRHEQHKDVCVCLCVPPECVRVCIYARLRHAPASKAKILPHRSARGHSSPPPFTCGDEGVEIRQSGSPGIARSVLMGRSTGQPTALAAPRERHLTELLFRSSPPPENIELASDRSASGSHNDRLKNN